MNQNRLRSSSPNEYLGTQESETGGMPRYKIADLKYDEDTGSNKMQSFNGSDMSLNETFINLNQLEEKDLKIAISKIRKQNELLRGQLKDLSDKLTDVLEKKSKQRTREDKPQEFKEDTLIKELENSKQQLAQYKKELQQFKNRLEMASGEDRLSKLEMILRQREQMLEDLGIENKNLQKINRDQERELKAYHKDFNYEKKINACNEDITALKEKVRDVQGVSRVNEKNFKKQQEYLTSLNHQYELVCQQVGVPTSFTFAKVEELNEYLAKKGKNEAHSEGEIIRQIKEDQKSTVVKPTEENIKELQGREDILQKQLQSLERKNQLKLNRLKADFNEIFKDTQKLQERLAEKEQESVNLDKKVTELKTVYKKTTISLAEPMKIPDNDILSADNISSSRQKNNDLREPKSSSNIRGNRIDPVVEGKKGPLETKPLPRLNEGNKPSHPTQPNPKTPKTPKTIKISEDSNKPVAKPTEEKLKEVHKVREVIGGRSGSGLLEFSDRDTVDNPVTSKIVKITLWIGDSYINGIQASYRVNDSEDVVGNQHLHPDMRGKTKVVESLQIDPDDRINFISGKYNEGLISLKFQTSKGKIKDFGDLKSDGEDFEIDMQGGEQPTLLFGSLVKMKNAKGKDETVLANVGFALVKKVMQ